MIGALSMTRDVRALPAFSVFFHDVRSFGFSIPLGQQLKKLNELLNVGVTGQQAIRTVGLFFFVNIQRFAVAAYRSTRQFLALTNSMLRWRYSL